MLKHLVVILVVVFIFAFGVWVWPGPESYIAIENDRTILPLATRIDKMERGEPLELGNPRR